MKKIIVFLFMTLLITVKSVCCWSLEEDKNTAQTDFFKNYIFNLGFDKEDIFTGSKLQFSAADIIISSKNNEYSGGISLFTDKYLEKYPCKFMIGNISIGGAFSKIKAPDIGTSSSGFSDCYTSSSELTGTLPYFSSFSNSLSCFIEGKYINKDSKFSLVLINGYYNFESKDYGFSSKIKFNFTDRINSSLLTALNINNKNENTPSTWYGTPYFKSDKYISCLSSIDLNLYNYYSNFSVFTYETPFGLYENIFKTENLIKYEYFQTSFSCLYNNSENIVLPSDSKIEKVLELKCNIQGNIPLLINQSNNKLKIKLGTTEFSKIYITEKTHKLDFSLSAGFDIPITSITLNTSLNSEINSYIKAININSFSFSFRNSWRLKKITPTFALSAKYYFKETKEIGENENYNIMAPHTQYYKAELNCNLSGNILKLNNYYSFYIKDGKINNKKLGITLFSTLDFKKIIINMKISGDFCI